MTDVKPGNIVRYTFGQGDLYDCDPENYRFQYLIRKVAQLDETTDKISPTSPHHDRLVNFVGTQPPAELHLQSLGFANAASMTQAERWDFQVMYPSDYQMYASSPNSPHGDLLEFDRDGEGKCGDGIVQEPEECDDGNTEDGDGCSAGCTVELSCDINQAQLKNEATDFHLLAVFAIAASAVLYGHGHGPPIILETIQHETKKRECA